MKVPMDDILINARDNFIQGMSRISQFWGFPRAMGAIYGVIYLSSQPICLDDLVEQANVTKGSVSTNVRSLERLGMVHRHIQIGERKDYYFAETDFWKIARGILRQREMSEFDRAIRTVDESLQTVQSVSPKSPDKSQAEFYRQRLVTMQHFFNSLDSLVATVMALDDLRINGLERLSGKANRPARPVHDQP
jgi:DNA-binding transcriptional regulator GbsR (MarR family)